MALRGAVETAVRQVLADLEKKIPNSSVDKITKHNGNEHRFITVKLPDDDESRTELGRIIGDAKSANPLISSVTIGYPRDLQEQYIKGAWVISFSET